MNGGYFMADCTGLDLSDSTSQTVNGLWDKAVTALKAEKPIIAYNCIYGSGVHVSPVTCFGWYIVSDEIVIVGATLHIHIKDDDSVLVLDVAGS